MNKQRRLFEGNQEMLEEVTHGRKELDLVYRTDGHVVISMKMTPLLRL